MTDTPDNHSSSDSEDHVEERDAVLLPQKSFFTFWQGMRTQVNPNFLAYLAGIVLVCFLACAEVKRTKEYLSNVPVCASDSPLPAGRRTIMPDYDSLRWIEMTQQTWNEGSLRLPHWVHDCEGDQVGHFVTWASPGMWVLEGLAYVRHLLTGEDMTVAIGGAAPYFNTFLWVLASMTLGALLIVAVGWRGAFIIPSLYAVLFPSLYGIFSCDYHLLQILSGLGMILCLAAPFLDEKRRRHEKVWFALAAGVSSFSLWLCASTQAQILVGVFIGFVFLPRESVRGVNPACWRIFGEISAILSAFLYFFEYGTLFPLDMFVNNPVYTCGVFVFGLWMWQMHVFIASGRRWNVFDARTLVYSALLLILSALPVLLNLPQCLTYVNPFHTRWYALVSEFQPVSIQSTFVENFFLCVAVTVGIVGMVKRRKLASPGEWTLFAFLAGCVMFFGYYGISCYRFLVFASVCLVTIACVSLPLSKKEIWGWLAGTFLLLNFISSVHDSARMTRATRVYGDISMIKGSIVERIASEKLLEADAGRGGTILSSPDASAVFGFYSGLPAICTDYWNFDVMLDTYSIFFTGVKDNRQANIRSKLKAYHISYIVISQAFDFRHSYVLTGSYGMLNPKATFAYYLLNTDTGKLAPWLRLESEDANFRIFRVLP